MKKKNTMDISKMKPGEIKTPERAVIEAPEGARTRGW